MQTETYPAPRESPRPHRTIQVFGIRTDDLETARLVTQVMHISSWMSLLALTSALLALFSGWWFTIGIVPAILIPCCGYIGSANRSRLAMWLFILFNAVFFCVFIGSLIASLVQTRGRFGTGAGAVFWVSLGIGLAMAALQIAGCMVGIKLVKSKHFKGREVEGSIPAGVSVVDVERRMYYPAYSPTPAPGQYVQQPQALAQANTYGQRSQGQSQGGYAHAYGGQPEYRYQGTFAAPPPAGHWQYAPYAPGTVTPVGSPPLAPAYGSTPPIATTKVVYEGTAMSTESKEPRQTTAMPAAPPSIQTPPATGSNAGAQSSGARPAEIV